mgnify:FL=1
MISFDVKYNMNWYLVIKKAGGIYMSQYTDMPMKFLALNEGIVNDYKDKLLLAFAFLHTECLFKPECSCFNENYGGKPQPGHLFGKDMYSISYGGVNKTIPTWEDFYNKHCDTEANFMCVAGCDKDDITRITLTILSGKMLPKELHNTIPISISEVISDEQVGMIINNIINKYEELKNRYQDIIK